MPGSKISRRQRWSAKQPNVTTEKSYEHDRTNRVAREESIFPVTRIHQSENERKNEKEKEKANRERN